MSNQLPQPTPDELKRVEQAKARHKEGEQFKVYPSVKGGIEGILRDRAVTQLYPITDFYKPSLVTKALNELVVTKAVAYLDAKGEKQQITTTVEYTTAQGEKRFIDHQTIKQALADNIELLKAFYDKEKQIAVTTYGVITAEALPKLEKYFDLETIQPNQWIPNTATITKDINGASSTEGRGVPIDELPELKETYATKPITGYLINDTKGLIKTIESLTPSEYLKYKSVEIMASQEGNTVDGLKSLFTDLIELTNACGLTDDSGQVMSIGDLVVNQIHLETLGIVSRTLLGVLESNQPTSAKSRSIVNIKDPESHSFIGRPTNTSFIDMVAGAIEGREFDKLKERYRNKDEREADGGFLAHIDNPQEALPFIYDDNDRPTLIKLVANSVAMAGDAIDALQAYRRDNPSYTGYVKVTDIAKYIDQYADDMARGKGLRPEYRQRILNGFTIATLMANDYIISKDKRDNTKVRKVYIVNRITEYEKNNNGTVIAIKNPDFTDEYKANLESGLNLGVITDGIRNLRDTETKVLARYISDRQVAKLKDTVAGKPLSYRADTLCKMAGITDQHITNRYKTLSKMLNELEAKQTIVGQWDTKAKTKNITGYNRDSQTIYITAPDKITKGYVTREATKAARNTQKIEQANRVKALIKYARGYTDLDVLADEIDVTRPELDQLLAGKAIVTDHILRQIDLEVTN